MFDTATINNSMVMTTPYGAYNSTGDDLFDAASDRSRFHRQKLGIYLLSDLFTSGFMGNSEYVHDKRLTSLARDKNLSYTGELFDQWDLDVLIHCVLNTTVSQGQAQKIQIDPATLLRESGLRNCEENRMRVYTSLFRLHTGSLLIEGKGYRYMTRFIDRVLLDQSKGCCLVEVNGDVSNSLRCERNLRHDIESRRFFRRNGLAKWIHGASMVFRSGFVADINSLHALCGASSRTKRIFPGMVAKALEGMETSGCVESWFFDGTRITVMPRFRQSGTACGYIANGMD